MIGAADPFREVTSWDEATAAGWASSLDSRAQEADQIQIRRRLRELAGLRPGGSVVELGCGTGHLLLELAGDVGPRGHVLGVEPQPLFADLARGRTAGNSVVTVRTGPAEQLPVADLTVDACVAQTVLIHLSAEELGRVLAEARRVLVRGGRIVSADQDGDTWVVDHPDRETTRRIARFNSDQRYADGWTGRKLARLLRAAGFSDCSVEVLVHADSEPGSYLFGSAIRLAGAAAEAGVIEPGAAEQWITELRELAAGGAFFASINYYLCAATRW